MVTVSQLLVDAFRASGFGALSNIKGYNQAYSLVSDCAQRIDELIKTYPDLAEQVNESIRMLRKAIDDAEPSDTLNVLRRLIEGRLYHRQWGASERERYDKKRAILLWRDFFVSYTNRDAPGMNQQFRSLILACLGKAPRTGDRDNNQNHVAKVIVRHLRRYQGLEGFFDEMNLRVGEDIEHEVTDYCRRSFAFVEIIEPLFFDRQPNWCYYEYSTFSATPEIQELFGDKDRHFFVLTEDELSEIVPANLAKAYGGWRDHIKRLKGMPLRGERNSTLRLKVKEIAKAIIALRSEVIEAWLTA